MRLAGRGALLVVLWLLAWGELSVANLASGVAVAAALLVAFPLDAPTGDRTRIDVVGVARLVAYVASELVLANLVMARTITRRNPMSNSGVVAYRLGEPSEIVVTFMTTIISLSPGTMTVDVDDDASTIEVHFFSLADPDAARARLARLERLVTGAIAAGAPTRPSNSAEGAA